jgi:hypothetical protein
VRLVLLDSANRQFQRADSWWREHRDELDLFHRDRDLIEIHAVWGARRRRGPAL